MLEKKAALIIDDDGLIRQILHDLLTSAGYSARCCTNGSAALDLSKKELFHIIITDYNMDGMNGADITKELRVHCPDSLIIGISGEPKERDFFEAGADAFYQKPFSSRELVSLIKDRMLP